MAAVCFVLFIYFKFFIIILRMRINVSFTNNYSFGGFTPSTIGEINRFPKSISTWKCSWIIIHYLYNWKKKDFHLIMVLRAKSVVAFWIIAALWGSNENIMESVIVVHTIWVYPNWKRLRLTFFFSVLSWRRLDISSMLIQKSILIKT